MTLNQWLHFQWKWIYQNIFNTAHTSNVFHPQKLALIIYLWTTKTYNKDFINTPIRQYIFAMKVLRQKRFVFLLNVFVHLKKFQLWRLRQKTRSRKKRERQKDFYILKIERISLRLYHAWRKEEKFVFLPNFKPGNISLFFFLFALSLWSDREREVRMAVCVTHLLRLERTLPGGCFKGE